jgi:hypothetical protein
MGWWGNWRLTAPAHIGDLQATDLLDCTSIIGGVEVNNTITGAQIIAGASGGGAVWGGITGTLSTQTDLQTALDTKPTNNLAIGTNVTGTTANTLSANILLPANTLQLGKPAMIHLKARGRRISSILGVISVGMYRNTSVSLTGATYIGQIQMTSTTSAGIFERHLYWNMTSSIAVQTPGTLVSDIINNGSYSTSIINPAVDNYFLFTIQCANAGDTGQINWALQIIYD